MSVDLSGITAAYNTNRDMLQGLADQQPDKILAQGGAQGAGIVAGG